MICYLNPLLLQTRKGYFCGVKNRELSQPTFGLQLFFKLTKYMIFLVVNVRIIKRCALALKHIVGNITICIFAKSCCSYQQTGRANLDLFSALFFLHKCFAKVSVASTCSRYLCSDVGLQWVKRHCEISIASLPVSKQERTSARRSPISCGSLSWFEYRMKVVPFHRAACICHRNQFQRQATKPSLLSFPANTVKCWVMLLS